MRNKRADMSEALQMNYRIFMVLLVAFVILGISATIYRNYIDVRTVEAEILNKKLFECLTENNMANTTLLEAYQNNILEYCGYSEEETSRFLAQVRLTLGTNMFTYQQGDSGSVWILDTIQSKQKAKSFSYHEPGFSETTYPVEVCLITPFPIQTTVCKNGQINIMTLVNEE